MIFNDHSNLKGTHALYSPSNYHWLHYTDEKFINTFHSTRAKEIGTQLHEFAESAIRLNQKLPKTKKTLNMYVNDTISFKMEPEVVLYYSNLFYGTTDALIFRNGLLRIHDLKTGTTPANMDQLLIYAALYCLEYQVKPEEIAIELRIYQMDQIIFYNPEPKEVRDCMNTIIHFDKLARKLIAEEG